MSYGWGPQNANNYNNPNPNLVSGNPYNPYPPTYQTPPTSQNPYGYDPKSFSSSSSSLPSTSLHSFHSQPTSSTVTKGPEIKLYANNRERTDQGQMADLFCLIKATEHLEAAYRRGAVPADVYTEQCWSLINQYRTTAELIKQVVPDPMRFIEEYNMNAPAARRRLIEVGVPATVEHGEGGMASGKAQKKANNSRLVANVVAGFITAMDSLRLNMFAVDQVQPLITDIVQNLNKLDILAPDFEGKVKMKDWLTQLNQMRASDNLSEDQARQLLFDLDSSYNAFHHELEKN